MKADEFVRAVSDGDFEALFGEDRIDEFTDFLFDAIQEGKKKLVIRFNMEADEGGSLFPYYAWAVYRILWNKTEDSISLVAAKFFVPQEGELNSYLEMPKELSGEKYFEAVLGDDDA